MSPPVQAATPGKLAGFTGVADSSLAAVDVKPLTVM